MGLAEGVAAGDQRDRLLVVHRHAREGLANVDRGLERIGIAVGAFRIDVDQAHLHGGQRMGEIAFAAVALVTQPLALGAPIGVVLRLPHVRAPAAEAGGLEAHRFQRAIAGEDQQIGPGELAPIFLLDRPQQDARLVEIGVVRPAVEGGETLLARAGAATTVTDAISAGGMPGHADEERAVMAKVRRPPILRGRHQREDVGLHRLQIEGLELLRIVVVLPHRIARRRVRMEHRQIQLVRPPEPVGHFEQDCVSAHRIAHRALRLDVHDTLRSSPSVSIERTDHCATVTVCPIA